MLREKGNKGDPVCVILFGYIGVERRLDYFLCTQVDGISGQQTKKECPDVAL